MKKFIASLIAGILIFGIAALVYAEKITFDEAGINIGDLISTQYSSLGINWVNDPQNKIADSAADFNNPFPADGNILWYTTKPASGAIQLDFLANYLSLQYRRPFSPGTINVELLNAGVSVYSVSIYWQSGEWETFVYDGGNGEFNQILMSSTNKFVIDTIEVRKPQTMYVYYLDNDGDGYGNPSITTTAASLPSGYVANNTDCNDSNASIHPDATEIVGDGIDQDCNGSDLVAPKTYYRDNDGDGYGNPNSSVTAASLPSGYVANNTDCNDSDASIHPGNSTEIAGDGIDQDCNGSDLPAQNISREIYRFFNTMTGAHFYTSSYDEMNYVIDNFPQFNYEGVAFSAAGSTSTSDLSPVYRFYNTVTATHFYTISEAEKDYILSSLPDLRLEGEAYSAHTTNSSGTKPLYRFYNTQTGTHFYTISDAEKESIQNTLPQYHYEGIAYYVE